MDVRAAPSSLARARWAVRIPEMPASVRGPSPHRLVVARRFDIARQRRLAMRLPPLARARRRLVVTPRPGPELHLDEHHRRGTTTTSVGGMTRHRRHRPAQIAALPPGDPPQRLAGTTPCAALPCLANACAWVIRWKR